MGFVGGGLDAFCGRDGIFDRPVVEAEFVRQFSQRVVVRITQVDPHQGVIVAEVFGELVELEVVLRLTRTPQAALDTRRDLHDHILSGGWRSRAGAGVGPWRRWPRRG